MITAKRAGLAWGVAALFGAASICAGAPAVAAEPTADASASSKIRIAPINGTAVVANRYLVETEGTPSALGGDNATNLTNQADVQQTVTDVGATTESTSTTLWTGMTVAADAGQIQKIAAEPAVTAVYPVLKVSLEQVKAAATTTKASAAKDLNALSTGYTGKGVKVGVIDTGIDYNHPQFGGSGTSGKNSDFKAAGNRVQYGYDFVGDAYNADEGTTPHPDAYPDDCEGHGTHVAGIIASTSYGLAPEATLGAYRIFGCDGGTDTTLILAALNRAYRDGMDIVNVSLGTELANWPDYPDAKAATNLAKKGVLVVGAAGNAGEDGLFSLGSVAAGTGVLAVASSDVNRKRVSSFSGTGLAADLSLKPNVTAPGGSITSTLPLDLAAYERSSWKYNATTSTGVASGTSMAAPQVSAAAALLIQASSSLKRHPNAVIQRLVATARPLTSTRKGLTGRYDAVFRQGAGLINVKAALKVRVVSSSTAIRLGEGTKRTVKVTLRNGDTRAHTYRASNWSGLSAAAGNGGYGTSKPKWAFGGATVKFSASKIRVAAKKSTTISVTITAPKKVLPTRAGLLYGGWLTFASTTGANTVRVPYAGLRGDYQALRVLPKSSYLSWKLPALGYVNSLGLLQKANAGRSFKTADGDVPLLVFHLAYAVSDVRLRITNVRTGRSYYGLTASGTSHLGELPRDADGQVTPVLPKVRSGSRWKRLAKGTYRVQLRVLKPLGKASKKSNWETYTSAKFRLA